MAKGDVRVVTMTELELLALAHSAATEAASNVAPPPEVMDVAEAAKFLRLSKGTVRKWAADGKLPHSRLGAGPGQLRFLRSALLEHLRKAS